MKYFDLLDFKLKSLEILDLAHAAQTQAVIRESIEAILKDIWQEAYEKGFNASWDCSASVFDDIDDVEYSAWGDLDDENFNK